MNKEILIELGWLIFGLLCAFLIISKVLGDYTWIVWIVVIPVLLYKLIKNKDWFDFWH